MRNLFIIGNGFDLAHNLKTSYNHFIDHIINIREKDPTAYSDIFHHGYYKTIRFDITDDIKRRKTIKNHFLGILLSEKTTTNWVDIEKLYFRELLKIKNNPINLKNLNTNFSIIKNYLEDYLSNHCTNEITIESYKNLFTKFDNRENVILNFNYTNTLERYDIKYAEIINIHGQLKNRENKIIFGYAANEQEENELIKMDNLDYLENIKRFRYLEALNELKLRNFIKNESPFEVHIIGHSMGLSDKQILNSIITHKAVKKIRTYFYKENYFETNISTHALLENSQTYIPMAPLPNCHQAPQYDEDSNFKKSFIKFIEEMKIEQSTSDRENGRNYHIK